MLHMRDFKISKFIIVYTLEKDVSDCNYPNILFIIHNKTALLYMYRFVIKIIIFKFSHKNPLEF